MSGQCFLYSVAVGCWEEKVSASTRLYKEVDYEKVGRWWVIDKREPITGTTDGQ